MKRFLSILLFLLPLAGGAQTIAVRIDSAKAYVNRTIVTNGQRAITGAQLNAAYGKVLTIDSLQNLTYLTSASALNGANLTSGSVPISKISATGTATFSTYLRGDGSWQIPAGGGGSSLPTQTGNAGKILTTDGSTASWVYSLGWINAADYCQPDAIQLYDGVITNGSATLTSSSATFSSADSGKIIEFIDVAGTHATTVKTIIAVNSAHSITVSSAYSYSAAGGRITYGHDCTDGLQLAYNDAFDQHKGVVYMPHGIYMLSHAPVTNTVQSVNPNSLLYIKYDDFYSSVLNSFNRASITIWGETAPTNNQCDYFSTGSPTFDDVLPQTAGTILYACYQTAVQSVLGDYPISILGTRGPSYVGDKNITSVYLRNLTFRVPIDNATKQSEYSGVNMMNCNSLFMDDCLVDANINATQLQMSGITAGVICPQSGSSPQGHINNVTVQGGFLVGIVGGEHCHIQHATIMANYIALSVPFMVHSMSFDKINVQMAAFAISRHNGYFSIPGGNGSILGGLLDIEANGTAGSGAQTPAAFNYQATIQDNGASPITGHIYYHIKESNTLTYNDNSLFSVSGSTSITANGI